MRVTYKDIGDKETDSLEKIKNKIDGNPTRALPQEARHIQKTTKLPSTVLKQFRKIEHRLKIIDPYTHFVCKKKKIFLDSIMFERYIRSYELTYIRNRLKAPEEEARLYYDKYADGSASYTIVLTRTGPDAVIYLAENIENDFPVKCFVIPFITKIDKKPTPSIKLKVCFFSKQFITYDQHKKNRERKEAEKRMKDKGR